MATITLTKLPARIVTVATTDAEYKFSHPSLDGGELLLMIELPSTNSGTVKICVGESANNDEVPAWPAGSKIPVEIQNGDQNLWIYASASDDEVWANALD